MCLDNGLDKIKSKEEFIQKYSNCIKKAQDAIPDDRKSRAYLFLAATAGMRLLQLANFKVIFYLEFKLTCFFVCLE